MLKVGQRGRIVSVPKGHTGKVGVQFESFDRKCEESMKTNKKLEEVHRTTPLVDWCDCEFYDNVKLFQVQRLKCPLVFQLMISFLKRAPLMSCSVRS